MKITPRRFLIPTMILLAWMVGISSTNAATCLNNNPPSNPDSIYSDHNDGTITDNRTGLMWKVCSEGQSWSPGVCSNSALSYPWLSALSLAEASTFAGYNDWRLPNLKELQSLVEECTNNPAINGNRFPNTPTSYSGASFWTSSPTINNTYSAWTVDFYEGRAQWVVGYTFVRLVRGGQSHNIPPTRFDPVIDSTIAPTPATNAVIITHGFGSNTDFWGREMAVDICQRRLSASPPVSE